MESALRYSTTGRDLPQIITDLQLLTDRLATELVTEISHARTTTIATTTLAAPPAPAPTHNLNFNFNFNSNSNSNFNVSADQNQGESADGGPLGSPCGAPTTATTNYTTRTVLLNNIQDAISEDNIIGIFLLLSIQAEDLPDICVTQFMDVVRSAVHCARNNKPVALLVSKNSKLSIRFLLDNEPVMFNHLQSPSSARKCSPSVAVPLHHLRCRPVAAFACSWRLPAWSAQATTACPLYTLSLY
jgi:hypothetical protein